MLWQKVRRYVKKSIRLLKRVVRKAVSYKNRCISWAQRQMTLNITDREPKPHTCAIMIHNTSMKRNVGGIIRTAAAFGVNQIIFVGKKKSMQTFGAHGCQRRMHTLYFDRLNDAVSYVHDSLRCSIVGIEIRPEALSLRENSPPFHGNTCFLLGNEGFGLSEQDASICDYFVYIPHAGSGTGSLNVSVACSLVLYQFKMVYCNAPEAAREDSKYLVQNNAACEAQDVYAD